MRITRYKLKNNIEQSSSAADVWSWGCILYNMLTSIPPFFNEDTDKLIKSIWNEPITFDRPEWYALNDEVKKLLSQMLEIDPIDRISVQDALDSPFLEESEVYSVIGSKIKMQANKTFQLMKNFKALKELQIAIYQFIVSLI